MPVALVQQTAIGTYTTGSPAQVVLTFAAGVTTGNTVVVAIGQSAASSRTYTTDLSGDTEAVLLAGTDSRRATIRYAFAVTGNPTTVTVTASSTNSMFRAIAYELSDVDTGAAVVTSSHQDATGSTNTHYCGAAGAIDTTVNSVAIAVAVNSSSSTNTATGSWVDDDAGTSQYFFAHLTAADALTDERGEYTGTNLRGSVGVIAAFLGTAPSSAVATWATNIGEVQVGGSTF